MIDEADDHAQTERQPRYLDEDTSPTTAQELKGWYAYGIAAEVFAVCGVGSFLPLTLEQLARERGVLWSDGKTPCVAGAVSASAAPTGLNNVSIAAVNATTEAIRLLVRGSGEQPENPDRCVVHLFGRSINTASFAMYTFSVAVLVQALILVSLSSFADYGKNRKFLLTTFGFTGAITSMLFILIFPPVYFLGAVLVIVGIVSLGCSFVILNSFLPVLVANHPSILKTNNARPPSQDSITLSALGEAGIEQEESFEGIGGPQAKPSETFPELQLSTQISSKGVGLGYAAAVLVQILSILFLFILSKTSVGKSSRTMPLKLVLLLVGLWWFTFTAVSIRWIRPRPGPPMDSSFLGQGSKIHSWALLVRAAWVKLWGIIKTAAKLRQMVVFLIAWFLLSDAVATVSGTAILFAKNELKMPTVQIAMVSIIATTSGIAGAFSWPRLSTRFNLKSNQTIIACLTCFELIPLYGLLGYFPFIKKWGVFGLQQTWEIFPLAFVHGFVSGGFSSYCRSLYGQLIPPGSEAAFYALYAVTDKGSSVFGPAIVGFMVDTTGQIRSGFIFLAVLILLPIPLIYLVDPEKGRADGLNMSAAIKASNGEETDVHRGEEREGLLSSSG